MINDIITLYLPGIAATGPVCKSCHVLTAPHPLVRRTESRQLMIICNDQGLNPTYDQEGHVRKGSEEKGRERERKRRERKEEKGKRRGRGGREGSGENVRRGKRKEEEWREGEK